MRTLKQRDVTEYLRQFPFLTKMVPITAFQEDPNMAVIKIEVHIADAETLYLCPKVVEFPNLTCSEDDKLTGYKHATVFAVNLNGEITDHAGWTGEDSDFYAKKVIGSGAFTTHLVIVICYQWYKRIANWVEKHLNSDVGQFFGYEYQVFIYKRPDHGFSRLMADYSLIKNVRIHDLATIVLKTCDDVEARVTYRRITDLIGTFNTKNSIVTRKAIARSGHHIIGKFGKTRLRVDATEGFSGILMNFNRGDSTVTLIMDEDGKNTRILSIDSDVETLAIMLEEVTENWSDVHLQNIRALF